MRKSIVAIVVAAGVMAGGWDGVPNERRENRE